MKKVSVIKNNKKIIFTLLLIFTLILLSVFISLHISCIEEKECWNTLHQASIQFNNQIKHQISYDQELLESIADIITYQDTIDSKEVQKIIDGFQPNTMISHIALLLPNNKIMLPNEPIRDTDGIISFEEESQLGKHISNRSVDVRDKESLILRNYVPVKK